MINDFACGNIIARLLILIVAYGTEQGGAAEGVGGGGGGYARFVCLNRERVI